MVALRRLFVETMQEADVARFVFVDETSTYLTYGRRYGRAPAGRRLDAAVAAAMGQVRAGFVHKDQTRHIFLRKGFQKQPAQAHDVGRIAFGGVDALFLRPHPRASVARQVVVRLRAGPPTAANSVRSSSSVASGWATKQARSCA